MSYSIRLNNFQHIPGQNDEEYIELLQDALARQRNLTSKAIAKLKKLKNAKPPLLTSVQDGKPKTKGYYLVYAPTFKPNTTTRPRNGFMFSYWNGKSWSTEAKANSPRYITHWMPLIPPREKHNASQ